MIFFKKKQQLKPQIQTTLKTALIAGSGQLPIVVANELQQQNVPLTIICLDDSNFQYFQDHNTQQNLYKVFNIKMEDVIDVLSIIKTHEIKQVICCGGVKFKGLNVIKFFKFSFIVKHLNLIKPILSAVFAKQKGDNFLLTLVEKILNRIGCKVVAVQDILPDIMCSKKDEINVKLAQRYFSDIKFGDEILNTMSSYDIGQSIVTHNGRVLGIEAYEGTQNLIKRCGKYYAEINEKNTQKTKPVLIKKSKLNQNRKLDIPTIGKQTILDLISANFAGLALENNGVFILDKEEVRELCEQNNLFLVIIDTKK